MRHLLWLLAACAACSAQTSGDPAPSDPTPLYEDDRPLPPGKSDSAALPPKHLVTDYTAVREAWKAYADIAPFWPDQAGIAEGQRVVPVRRGAIDGTPMVVWVDADTLATGVVAADALLEGAANVAVEDFADARYLRALAASRETPLTGVPPAGEAARGRFAVTIDMCQSSRAWEAGLFDWLRALSAKLEAPVPVGIALTGLWSHRHPDDFEKLLAWQDEGVLDITWIDHSFHHQLSKDAAGRYHFLTAADIDFPSEVAQLETLLLAHGRVPSVLFRFPGLTHDATRLAQTNDLSLFALDANAWIAKGQPIVDGGVVLLHGNGNEAIGVTMFFDQIGALDEALTSGAWALVSPVESVASLPLTAEP